MSKIVQAKWAIAPNAYDSFKAANRAADASITQLMNHKKSLVNGKIVLWHKLSYDTVIICFESDLYLTVGIGENVIVWDVVREEPILNTNDIEDDLEFKFDNGEKIPWDTNAVLNTLKENSVAISPSDQFLFLLSRKGIEYMFNFVVDLCGRKYLVLSEV